MIQRSTMSMTSAERMMKHRRKVKQDKQKSNEKLAQERARAKKHRDKMKDAEKRCSALLEERRRKDAERQRRCREKKKKNLSNKTESSQTPQYVSKRTLRKQEIKPCMVLRLEWGAEKCFMRNEEKCNNAIPPPCDGPAEWTCKY